MPQNVGWQKLLALGKLKRTETPYNVRLSSQCFDSLRHKWDQKVFGIVLVLYACMFFMQFDHTYVRLKL